MSDNSPNWYWQKLGCRVIKESQFARKIVDYLSRVVCTKAGYDFELSIARFLNGE